MYHPGVRVAHWSSFAKTGTHPRNPGNSARQRDHGGWNGRCEWVESMVRLFATGLVSLACLAAIAPGCAEPPSEPMRLKSSTKKPTPPAKSSGSTNGSGDGVPTKGDSAPTSDSPPTSTSDGAPTLTAVSPDAITLGTAPAGGVQITVTGTRFATGMKIDLAGDQFDTNVAGPTSLTATLPANKLQASGMYRLAIAKGTTQSNPLTFTVANPTSVLVSSITPATAIVGATTSVTLSVSGSGFVPSSAVKLNGAALPTTFKSATSLEATIPASAFIDAGKYSVVVANGTDVVSLPTSFEVRNPAPATSSISPASTTAGAAATAVTISGTGFTRSSEIVASGTPVTTTYLSATQLRATLPASMLTTARTLSLVVQTPGPGGGTSGGRTFTVTAETGTSSGSSGNAPNPSCLYQCDDYGYAPDQCYEGWICIATGMYAGCLGQTQCPP